VSGQITPDPVRLVRRRLEYLVEGSHSWCKHLGADVLVAVRHKQRRVAEQRLHGSSGDAERSQDRRGCVASIVQSRFGDAGHCEKVLPSPVVLTRVHRLTQGPSED
jgi:hypothetical protein